MGKSFSPRCSGGLLLAAAALCFWGAAGKVTAPTPLFPGVRPGAAPAAREEGMGREMQGWGSLVSERRGAWRLPGGAAGRAAAAAQLVSPCRWPWFACGVNSAGRETRGSRCASPSPASSGLRSPPRCRGGSRRGRRALRGGTAGAGNWL